MVELAHLSVTLCAFRSTSTEATNVGPFGSKRGCPDPGSCLWPNSHPQLSRWLTFRLKCSYADFADGDWTGNEEPATLTAYKRGRRRY